MKKIRKILALTLAVFMLVGLMPGNVFAEDTRIKISTITATSNIDSILGLGKKVKTPTFTVTEGSPAYFNNSMNTMWSEDWGYTWQTYYSETFEEGTYMYETAICIDGEAAKTYVLDENLKVTVDGKAWFFRNVIIEPDRSYVFVNSPRFVVTNPAKPTVQGSKEFVYDESEKQ